MNWLVVTPSNRTFDPAFFEPLKDCDWIVIDDSGGKIDYPEAIKKRAIIANDDFMFAELGLAANELVPRKSAACKNFGLWWAVKEKYDGVILLDSDCDIRYTDYVEKIPVGKLVNAWTYETPSGWHNPMRQVRNKTGDMYSRGYPYENRGEMFALAKPVHTSPKFNQGLLVGEPDISGIDQLQIGRPHDDFSWVIDGMQKSAMPELVVLGKRQKLPLSISNAQLLLELIPAFYQPPNWNMSGNLSVSRHEDTFSMYVLKSLMDLKGDVVTSGNPLALHRQTSKAIHDVLAEHYTMLLQPHLMRLVDDAITYVTVYSGTESYGDIAEMLGVRMERILRVNSLRIPDSFVPILSDYSRRIVAWSRLCQYGSNALTRRVVPVSQKLL